MKGKKKEAASQPPRKTEARQILEDLILSEDEVRLYMKYLDLQEALLNSIETELKKKLDKDLEPDSIFQEPYRSIKSIKDRLINPQRSPLYRTDIQPECYRVAIIVSGIKAAWDKENLGIKQLDAILRGQSSGQSRRDKDPRGLKKSVRKMAKKFWDRGTSKRNWVATILRELELDKKKPKIPSRPTIMSWISDIYNQPPKK